MADYKRKKVHKILPKAPRKNNKSAHLEPSVPQRRKSASENTERSMRVLKGNYERKHRVKKFFTGVLCVIIACAVIVALFPVTLGENITNAFAVMGVGKYPNEIDGTVTLNAESKGLYYYVLTDTNIMAFSKNGKELFSVSHGFSSPVLKTSSTRALLLDQGGKKVSIYNLLGPKKSFETDSPIINGNISSSGAFAIATKPENYASTVTVYNSRFKKTYEWNSAKETVNNVTLSPNGRKIAVSTINVSLAKFESNVYVLTKKSADAIFSLNLDEKPVMDMNSYNSGFYVVTEDTYRHIKWSNFTTLSVSATGEIDMMRRSNRGSVLVFNRANDRGDNTIVIVSKRGRKVSEFKVNTIINDIEMSNGHIYCASDSKVMLYNKKGENIFLGNCGYGCERLAVIGSHSVAVINDNNIDKLVLEETR